MKPSQLKKIQSLAAKGHDLEALYVIYLKAKDYIKAEARHSPKAMEVFKSLETCEEMVLRNDKKKH